MSKMSELHRELSEQAYDLGFLSLEDAENHGWRVNYEQAKLEPPVVQPSLDEMKEQEKAHEAWLKEKHEVLHLLESVKEDIIDLNGGDNNHVAIDELNYVIDFIEKGEV